MELNDYQEKAAETIQRYETENQDLVAFLGIIGEVGSVVTQLKRKLRDGDSYVAYKENLCEELGDVLWYISTIAKQAGLSLEEVAQFNLEKTADRFKHPDPSELPDFDSEYPENERFPDVLEIEFRPISHNGRDCMEIVNVETGERIGDPLTDNTYEDDGYRFHDIFHYGYMAILGWSPVLRKLLDCKRRSNLAVDENEDGARGAITEELVSLFINYHAMEHDLLRYANNVDSTIIKEVRVLVKKTEARRISGKQWEKAILDSYKVFDELRANDGGRVLVSRMERSISYVGPIQLQEALPMGN
jgi:NTP pyrophosphatase (non-canonical NTP hydrolase)